MKKMSLFCALFILLFACTNNNEDDLIFNEEQEILVTNEEENTGPVVPLKDNSYDCSKSEVFDPYFTGTACCIERITPLSLQDTIRYWYSTNLDDPSFEWEVISGEIEIIAGQNSAIVTILLKEGFDGGVIRGLGTSSPLGLECSDLVTIEKLEEE